LAAQAVSKASNRIKVCFIELIVTNCKHPRAKLQTRGLAGAGEIVAVSVAAAAVALGQFRVTLLAVLLLADDVQRFEG
jgi:hypothetical protein